MEYNESQYCLVQHFNTWYEKAKLGKRVDMAEPCEKCARVLGCDFNWAKKITPICEEAGIYYDARILGKKARRRIRRKKVIACFHSVMSWIRPKL